MNQREKKAKRDQATKWGKGVVTRGELDSGIGRQNQRIRKAGHLCQAVGEIQNGKKEKRNGLRTVESLRETKNTPTTKQE